MPGTGLVGIATSRKIGTAPRRNRTKRRFREAIRLQTLTHQGLDYVLIVKQDAATAPFERILIDVAALFQEAKGRWADELEFS
jgi:ribonuclease P protein component